MPVASDVEGARVFPQHITSVLASGQAGGRLDGRLAWTATPPSGAEQTEWSVGLVAELDASSLLREHPGDDFQVGVFGYILTADGALVGHINRSFSFRAPWKRGVTDHQGLRVIHRTGLPPGNYTVRVVVEEAVTQRHLLFVTDLEIPHDRPSSPVLMAPLVAAPADGWVTVETIHPESEFDPVVVAEGTFLPLPRAVAVPGKTCELILIGAGWGEELRATARWIDENGLDRGHPEVRIAARSGQPGNGSLLLHASLDSPTLPIGDYTLMLKLEDTTTGAFSTRAVPAIVVTGAREVVLASMDDGEDEPSEEVSVELETRDIGSISAQTIALLLSGQRGGEIAGSLIWTVSPEPADGGFANVLIFVDTDGRTLLEEHPTEDLDIGIFAYVFSDDGRLAAHLAQGLSLDLTIYEAMLLARGLKFAGRFSLPPGDYFVRLLVRNQNSGRVYLTQARIDIPRQIDDERLLLPPIFDEQRAGWIMARQGALDVGSIGVHLSEANVLPSSRVVVESRSHSELFLGGSGWDDTARISARVADAKGRQLAEPLIVIDGPVTGEDGVVRFYRATLGPLDLPPGFYTLEVILDDETSGSRLSHRLPLAVVVTRGPLVLQAELREGRALPDLQSNSLTATAPALSSGEFAAKYAEALYQLGGGDRYGARDAVVALERSALAAGGQRELATIAKIERQVVHDLTAMDRSVLRPISLLHRDVFRQHVAYGEPRLADHSWPLAAEFAEQARGQQQLDQDPTFTQTLLLSLAADLVRSAAISPAIDLLIRVTELAPNDPSALLALGATYERSGRYDEAIAPLRRLVDTDPANAEGELRLAVNLARRGTRDEAEAHFRRLIEDNTPSWITVIAYQEMARLMPPLEAERVLREGVERYPGNQALRVQLAFTLDVSGRAAEAAALVGNICRRASAPETSPRVRYPAWPTLGVDGRIQVFAEEAADILPALVAALDARAVENGDGST